jgi:histidyl-tRNA synthetase
MTSDPAAALPPAKSGPPPSSDSAGSPASRSFQVPRGMRDVLPEQIPAWELLEGVARRLAAGCGYREIRPPLLEETALFTRSVGEVTDIVQKEMFTLERGGDSFTLRPEGTAGTVRAYLEAGYHKQTPFQKLFYIGPMFRNERPQKGRERMFTQFGVECIGSTDPRLDAEAIDLAATFFETLGIPKADGAGNGIEVRLNSMGDGADRDRYRDAVREFLRPTIAQHCELCRSRYEKNPLRVLDCKNEACQALHVGAPRLLDFLSDENRAHFELVRASLADLGRASVVDAGIVRGLDYYTRTVFELHYPKLGARSALCGGGRYDHLVRDLGGPDLGAVGFAIGFTSTLIVLEELGLLAAVAPRPADAYVAALDASLAREALKICAELRRGGVSAVFDAEGRGLKSQMKSAAKAGHPLVVVIGSDELARGAVQLKQMARQEQREVPRAELVAAARAALSA